MNMTNTTDSFLFVKLFSFMKRKGLKGIWKRKEQRQRDRKIKISNDNLKLLLGIFIIGFGIMGYMYFQFPLQSPELESYCWFEVCYNNMCNSAKVYNVTEGVLGKTGCEIIEDNCDNTNGWKCKWFENRNGVMTCECNL